MSPLVVVGDALLDVDLAGISTRLAPDAPVPVVDDIEERPRPGGAALAALMASRAGAEVVLLSPLADDAAAGRLRAVLAELAPGVTVVALPWTGSTPVKTRVRVAGQSLVRLDTGGTTGAVGDLPPKALSALRSAAGVLVADYGRGTTAAAPVRRAIDDLPRRTPVVWDPHPRGAAPVEGVRLATPNLAEALQFSRADLDASETADSRGAHAGSPVAVAARAADHLVHQWRSSSVAVTLGSDGALLSFGEGAPMVVPVPPVAAVDACGAGDCFAATAAAVLAAGGLPSEAVQRAVAAAAVFVAAGGAAAVAGGSRGGTRTGEASDAVSSLRGSVDEIVHRTRAAGGTIVATGGCFDLLHAGHVATLAAARALGDCLIVCLNSDDSVRRLKGPQRPLQTQEDRARVLEALVPVDGVVVFDEDTPHAVLQRLRPDIWAKGGDYSGTDLPEAKVLDAWGARAVVLPYVDGRSTSSLVAQVRASAGGLHVRPKDPAN